MERELQQRVSGIARCGAEWGVWRSGVFQQYRLLLRRQRNSEKFLLLERKTFHDSCPDQRVLHLSRRVAQRLGQRNIEWHCLGDRKYGLRRPARFRRE